MKRLGIFVFFDKEGVADRYIDYLLKSISKVLDELCIVVNGYIEPDSRKRLEEYAQSFYVRENSGYDAGAYKCVLENLLRDGLLKAFDELVLFNDTFYGPFWGFEQVFNEMEDDECDIWGLSSHEPIKSMQNPDFFLGWHLQSYFLVVKENALHSDTFADFWNSYLISDDYNDTVFRFEASFSAMMKEAGFSLKAYSELEKYKYPNPYDNYDYSLLITDEMTMATHYPVLKKRAFIENGRMNPSLRILLKYLDTHSDYDANLIWENLARKYLFSDLFGGYGYFSHVSPIQISSDSSIAIIVYGTSENFFDEVSSGLSELDENIQIKNCTPGNKDNRSLLDTLEDLKDVRYVGILAEDSQHDDFSKYSRSIQRKRIMDNLFCAETLNGCIRMLDNCPTLGAIYAIPDPDINGTMIHNGFVLNSIDEFFRNAGIVLYGLHRFPLLVGEKSGWYRKEILLDTLNSVSGSDGLEVFQGMPYYMFLKGYMPRFVGTDIYFEQVVNTYMLRDDRECELLAIEMAKNQSGD